MLSILLRGVAAQALNSSLDVSQYAHTAWTLRDGVIEGYPRSITQTTDGYLWLATEFGPVKFDGVRFVRWQPPFPDALQDRSVTKLLAGRDGSLRIGTSRGLLQVTGGGVREWPELNEQYVGALLEDREGAVWASTSGGLTAAARLCAIRDGRVRCFGANGSFGRFVLALHEDRKGVVWVGAASGLWRWSPEPSRVYPLRLPLQEIHSIIEDARGAILVAINREIDQLANDHFEPLRLSVPQLRPTALLLDRDGGLWIGTQDQGLLHLHHGNLDRFSRRDGLSGNSVQALFEDREGTIWVGTLDGMDRFRDFAVSTISTRQGLSGDSVMSVLASRDGVWLGTINGVNHVTSKGITHDRWLGGTPNTVAASLFADRQGRLLVSSSSGLFAIQAGLSRRLTGALSGYVYAMVEDVSGDVWISDQERGLASLRGDTIVESIPWSQLGGSPARALAADPVDGGLWLGFLRGGLAYFKDGRIRRSYAVAEGLGRGEVGGLLVEKDGRLWAATHGGLSTVHEGRVTTLGVKDGLPCDVLHSLIDDDTRSLWLYAACGLVRIQRPAIERWIQNPSQGVDVTVYDGSDGIEGHIDLGSYGPKVARSADGRLWFATYDGVGVIDLPHLRLNNVTPPVRIEQIVADRAVYTADQFIRLPTQVKDLRIDYTALSLVVPEKVHFRYKLEGRDQNWVNARNRREAYYTDLSPKSYRFVVTASNNDGVWNESGATIEFSIPPAFYQTTTFRAATALAALLGLWFVYYLRLRRVAAQLNSRFEERLDERTRIARELHDTLLQGSLSASMQLQVVTEQLTDHSVKLRLDGILNHFTRVIEDGRQTIQGLRVTPRVSEDLAKALARDAEMLRGQQDIDIRVAVEGTPRPIQPLTRLEIYQIGREALANACGHARATLIEIAFEYQSDALRVSVRDNGCGIDQNIVDFGRAGHWGIRGMRERAERVGGTLKVWSRVNGGTEVELRVPGEVAFLSPLTRRATRWWRRSRRVSPTAKRSGT